MKDLGCANSWSARIVYPTWDDMRNKTNGVVEKADTTPPEFTACRAADHNPTTQKKGNCWYQYTCPICGITWDVDSSD